MIMSVPVAVVVPIYQSNLAESEWLSLRQCLKILGNHPIIIIKPESLTISNILAKFPQLIVQDFTDSYFADIAGYNHLLTSTHFYDAFSEYDFILIYQLDALVFKDELKIWCQKGYDYIGAPAIPATTSFFDTKLPILNGGLSLRNVRKCRRLVSVYQRFFGQWLGNEDMLFSMAAGRLIPFRWLLKLPQWQQALDFAFEQNVEKAFDLNQRRLPFGVHAWEKYNIEFWQKHIDFLYPPISPSKVKEDS